MSTAMISTVVGIALGLVALGGMSWGAWDLKQEVGSNTSWRLIQTFERLTIVRKGRRLTQVEWLTWCQAGIDLRVFVSCPPR